MITLNASITAKRCAKHSAYFFSWLSFRQYCFLQMSVLLLT